MDHSTEVQTQQHHGDDVSPVGRTFAKFLNPSISLTQVQAIIPHQRLGLSY